MPGLTSIERESGVRASLRNGSLLALAKFYYLLVRGAYIVFFARLIGLEAYGYYSYAQNWYVLFLPLAMWGVNELVISELVRTGPGDRGALLGSGLCLRLLLGVCFALIIMLAAVLVEPDSQLLLLICIYTQGLFARSIANWYSALFVAEGRSHYWLYLSVPFMTLEILLALLLASRGASLVAIAWMQCTLWWLLLFSSYLVHRSRLGRIKARCSRVYLWFFFNRGASLGAAAFLMSCLTPGLLILYRNLAGDIGRIGEVALVLQVIMILDQTFMVVSNAALPALNRASPDSMARRRDFIRISWLGACYGGGGVAVACLALMPLAMTLFPAPMFTDAALLFAGASWLVIPLVAIHSFRLILISGGRIHSFLLILLCGVVVLLAMVWLLAQAGHLQAGSLFTALGLDFSVIALLLLALIVRHYGPMPLARFLFAPLALCLAFAVLYALSGSPPLVRAGIALCLLAGAAGFQYRRAW